MKQTKKLLAILLATLMMVACLAACGDSKSKKKDDDDDTVITTTVADADDDADVTTTTTAAPTQAQDDVASVAGSTYVFSDYQGYEEELMKSFLEGMYYTFDEDGTGYAGSSLSDEETTFKYTQNKDTLTLTDAGDGSFGQSEIFKIVGDTITISEEVEIEEGTTDNMTLVFTKQ